MRQNAPKCTKMRSPRPSDVVGSLFISPSLSCYNVDMNQPDLTTEQQQALKQSHGFVQGASYVLMTVDLYREMMGVGSEDEMQKSVAAIEEGLQDVEAGRTRSMDAVFQELDDKYGVHD